MKLKHISLDDANTYTTWQKSAILRYDLQVFVISINQSIQITSMALKLWSEMIIATETMQFLSILISVLLLLISQLFSRD